MALQAAGAIAAEQRVIAVAGDKPVVAGAAVEDVRSIKTVQAIGAGEAAQRIGAGAARQMVVQAVACAGMACPDQLEVFHVVGERVVGIGPDGVEALVRQLDHLIGRASCRERVSKQV